MITAIGPGPYLDGAGLSHAGRRRSPSALPPSCGVSGWMILGAIVAGEGRSAGVMLPRVVGLVAYMVLIFASSGGPAAGDRAPPHPGGLRLTAVPTCDLPLSRPPSKQSGHFAIIGARHRVALHDDRRFVEEWKRRVSPIVGAFFLPIFFAYTVRTDVGTIQGWSGAGHCPGAGRRIRQQARRCLPGRSSSARVSEARSPLASA
jgi:hypothetical protein